MVSPAAVMPVAWNSPCSFSRSKVSATPPRLQHLLAAKAPAGRRPLHRAGCAAGTARRGRGRAACRLCSRLRSIAPGISFIWSRSIRTLVETYGCGSQRIDVAADGLLRGAVAVERRGVDPVDAAGDRARCSARTAVGLVALDQDAAGDAAAERDFGDQQPGAPEEVFPHHSFLMPRRPQTRIPRAIQRCPIESVCSRGNQRPRISARSLKRWIFPVAVFGRSVRNSIQRGYL